MANPPDMTSVSRRAAELIQHLLPKVAAVAAPQGSPADLIDLSSAENTLLRTELQEICRSVFEGPPSNEVYALNTDFGGYAYARETLATFFNTYFHPATQLSAEHIVITPGAGKCLEALVQSICDQGDSVLIPAPFWFGFEPYISGIPKVSVVVASPPSHVSHAHDLLASLEAAYSGTDEPSRIKALILTNPHNPFSQCYPREALEACVNFCQQHSLHLVTDELYALARIGDQNSEHPPFLSALSLPAKDGVDLSKVHVIWSASKLFGFSGLRIGCIISPHNPSLRAAMSLITYAGTSALSAKALSTILSSPQLPSLFSINSSRLAAAHEIFVSGFRNLGIQFLPASEGLFIFARVVKDAKSPQDEMMGIAKLRGCGVGVSPGIFYGGRSGQFGWARVLIGVDMAVAEEAVKRIGKFVQAA